MKPLRAGVAVLSGCAFTVALVPGAVWGKAGHQFRSAAPLAGTTRYVSPIGSDNGACTSSGTPQYAVDQAAAGDEIRVAGGTYTGARTRFQLFLRTSGR